MENVIRNSAILWALMFGWALVAFPTLCPAQIAPDKTISTIGKWDISTALYGVGCVARSVYSQDGYEISISGEDIGRLKLLITFDPKLFDTKLDGSEEDSSAIEIALADNRWGNVKEYGFRGTSGVVLGADAPFLKSFALSGAIKVTERGHEKLRIEIQQPKTVLAELEKCFAREKPNSSKATSPETASLQALEGKWYADSVKVVPRQHP